MTKSAITLMAATSFAMMCAAGAAQGQGWSYEAPADPSVWSELSDEYKACAGNEQSPINIPTERVIKADASAVEIAWAPFKPEVVNNGYTIQVNTKGQAGYATVNGKRYDFLQFHFHHLSEHTINEEHGQMEVHFVHKSDKGDLLVVGAMIEVGSENSVLSVAWPLIPAEGGANMGDTVIDPYALIPVDEAAYRYAGSLTTPSCSEIVTWNLMVSPIFASQEQIDAFAEIYENNYRPVQKIGRRFILKIEEDE